MVDSLGRHLEFVLMVGRINKLSLLTFVPLHLKYEALVFTKVTEIVQCCLQLALNGVSGLTLCSNLRLIRCEATKVILNHKGKYSIKQMLL